MTYTKKPYTCSGGKMAIALLSTLKILDGNVYYRGIVLNIGIIKKMHSNNCNVVGKAYL
ncbi:hypothetical protein [Aerosakkonema funiforme]|uniref:hypothetical protein n=1 Tax=Aerosakkonema funiforme TaxID=1246630 RepID=UPI001689E20B|nr:hypothetical protein [Aerosakkonema funiforme]